MSLPIHGVGLVGFGRLLRRLGVTHDGTVNVPGLALGVQPVLELGAVLATPGIQASSQSITGNGNKTLATVPAGRRWRLLGAHIAVSGGGTFTHSDLVAQDASSATPNQHKLDEYSNNAATNRLVSLGNYLAGPVTLDQADVLFTTISGWSVSGTLVATFWIEEEQTW